jgi:hypothetical protein
MGGAHLGRAGAWVQQLREQLDGDAWQEAHVTKESKSYMFEVFTNTIHAHTIKLYSCAETHEVARRATSSLHSSM